MSDLSWLNPTPHAIAVYASQPLSPVTTQHSLPSGRYSLLGPDSYEAPHVKGWIWRPWRTHPPWIAVFSSCLLQPLKLSAPRQSGSRRFAGTPQSNQELARHGDDRD